MKILLLDIETAPNKVYTWGLREQDVGINQIIESGYILCWSAKWFGNGPLIFDSVLKSSPKVMVGAMHKLLDEADVVVTYNGASFDLPTLNKEFLQFSIKPPAPYKHIDLYQVIKRTLRFQSNKLDYITQHLGLGSKIKHKGMELWDECMKKDESAWRVMERYNKRDVTLLEKLYVLLRPWIRNHPNHATYEDAMVCPKCGSDHVQHRGTQVMAAKKYPRYQCRDCGGWFRSNKASSERAAERFVQV